MVKENISFQVCLNMSCMVLSRRISRVNSTITRQLGSCESSRFKKPPNKIRFRLEKVTQHLTLYFDIDRKSRVIANKRMRKSALYKQRSHNRQSLCN